MKKIAIIDSGLGGLSVLNEIQKLLPDEELIYFGDSLNVPYGDKTNEEIRMFTFRILHFLKDFDIKMLVIACNTINSFLFLDIVNLVDYDVIGVTFPTVDYVNSLGLKKVGLIATSRTVENNFYQKMLESNVYALKTPSFVELVEGNKMNTDESYNEVANVLSDMGKQGVQALILGCTHYPFLMNEIKSVYDGTIIDSGFVCALEVKQRLKSFNKQGSIQIYISDKFDQYHTIISNSFDFAYDLVEVDLVENHYRIK